MQLSSNVLFNTLKHHAGCIREYIEEARSQQFNRDKIASDLLIIGNSMIDIYYGELTPLQVIKEVKKQLKSMGCKDEEEAYRQFILASPKKYQTVAICDGSSWTLLLSRERGKYLHIHPSRKSAYTVRARAIALRTAIYLFIFHENELSSNLVSLVNKIRNEYMHESPIKNKRYTRGLQRILAIL